MSQTRPRPNAQRRRLDERLVLSYQPVAPDHGQPELALMDERRIGRRFVILALGEEATRLWSMCALPDELLAKGKRALEKGEFDA